MAHIQKKRQSGTTFLRIVIPAPAFCWSMISGQTLRVCPEGKPVPTHRVVAQGHAFPDHARVQPPILNCARVGDDDDAGGG